METLIDNPAFHTYAVCASILTFKMILSGFYTAAMRRSSTGYANAEDALAFGGTATGAPGVDTPQVAHALRIQRNDGENILPFFAIGLLYVISGASAFAASVYFWTYTAARVSHTAVYLLHLQPWRAICFFVGVLCMLGMMVQIVSAVM